MGTFTVGFFQCVCAKLLQSCLTFATLWTVACQGPLSVDSPGKNIDMGCHTLLQGIFPSQGSYLHLLCLLQWQVGSFPLVPPEKPEDFFVLSCWVICNSLQPHRLWHPSLHNPWNSLYYLLNMWLTYVSLFPLHPEKRRKFTKRWRLILFVLAVLFYLLSLTHYLSLLHLL